MTIVVFALAGSIGAVARYLVSGAIQRRSGSSMAVGTATVNLIGAFALGLVVGAGDGAAAPTVAAIGFTGGFTTFSTWMIETIRLGLTPRPSLATTMNLIVLPALGVALAALGYQVTS